MGQAVGGVAPTNRLALCATASTPVVAVAYRCAANEATAVTLDDSGEPNLECSAVDALALRSLRQRYDFGG